MNHKIHSVKYNLIMNFILTATLFIFPLITFPYVSRGWQKSAYHPHDSRPENEED